jgi:hypothetical protein
VFTTPKNFQVLFRFLTFDVVYAVSIQFHPDLERKAVGTGSKLIIFRPPSPLKCTWHEINGFGML